MNGAALPLHVALHAGGWILKLEPRMYVSNRSSARTRPVSIVMTNNLRDACVWPTPEAARRALVVIRRTGQRLLEAA